MIICLQCRVTRAAPAATAATAVHVTNGTFAGLPGDSSTLSYSDAHATTVSLLNMELIRNEGNEGLDTKTEQTGLELETTNRKS